MRFLILAPLIMLTACERAESGTFYLFRTPVAGSERVHVATFDARDGRDYNEENCTVVRDLMQSQPGVQVSYWCTALKP